MFTKILITVAVIIAALILLRRKAEARPGVRRAAAAPKVKPPLHLRLLPYAVVIALLAVGSLLYWLDWREAHRLYTVRVTDTRSGEVRSYPVYRDAVRGRSFETVDGRTITLADVERMELVVAE